MKKQIITLSTLALIAMLGACKKDDTTSNTNNNNNNNNNNTNTYYIKAKINGTLYEGYALASHMLDDVSVGTTINYGGKQTAFVVTAEKFSGLKTYADSVSSIDLGDTGYGYSDFLNGNSTVKITADDGKTLDGEFSGRVYSYEDETKFVDITEGVIHAKWSN